MRVTHITIKFHQLLVIDRRFLPTFIVQVICMVPIRAMLRFFVGLLCLSDEITESGDILAARLKVQCSTYTYSS